MRTFFGWLVVGVLCCACGEPGAVSPDDLEVIKSFKSAGAEGGFLSVAVNETHAFAGADGIYVYRLGSGTDAELIAEYEPPYAGPHRIENMQVRGTALYYDDYRGTHVVDIRDPMKLAETMLTKELGPDATRLAATRPRTLIPARHPSNDRVILWDFTDPLQPKQSSVTAVLTGSGIDSLDIDDGTTLFTSGSRLELFDVAIPDVPVKLGALDEQCYQIFHAGEGAVYCGIGRKTGPPATYHHVADVRDPKKPVFIGLDTERTGGWSQAKSFVRYGQWVFVRQAYQGAGIVEAYDISDPLHPKFTPHNLGGGGNQVSANSRFLLIAEDTQLALCGRGQ